MFFLEIDSPDPRLDDMKQKFDKISLADPSKITILDGKIDSLIDKVRIEPVFTLKSLPASYLDLYTTTFFDQCSICNKTGILSICLLCSETICTSTCDVIDQSRSFSSLP